MSHGTHKGREVIDETCSCGHLRSDHCDRFAKGHGACKWIDCNCEQFTWQSFVFAPEN